MSLATGEWLQALRVEYLESFIADGGAAVKVAVAQEPAADVVDGISRLATELGYVVVVADAARTRVDRIDRLFSAISAQVDWLQLAGFVRERAIMESGYVLPDREFTPIPTLTTIATVNGVEPAFVGKTLQQWFTEHIFREYRMSQDLRAAMSHLCFAPLASASTQPSELELAIVDWLKGDLRLISAVRRVQIYQKVVRQNARDLFISLGPWTRVAGKKGLVAIVDMRAVASRDRQPGNFSYTRAAVLDLYEGIRQFIDATDEMDACLVVFVASPQFLTDDSRGMAAYRALQMRLAEEVRGRRRDNPMASLIRVGGND